MFKRIVITLLLVVLTTYIVSCGKKRITELKKEQLFKIRIGNDEEEIAINRNKNGFFEGPGDFIFRNGFFYLVDKINQKIMKITTIGDVI